MQETRVDSDGNVSAADIVQSINRDSVDNVSTLLARLADHTIGDRVTMHIWRDGKELDVDVVLQGEN